MIKENIAKLQQHIQTIAQQCNRNPNDITLIVVTKNQPLEAIKEVIDAGIKHLAENRVQEYIPKAKAFSAVQWHFIGHLQTNKVKKLLKGAPPVLLHSLDRMRLLQTLEKQCAKLAIQELRCLVQLRISGEATKHGATEEEAEAMIRYVIEKDTPIRLMGFMGMAAFTDDKQIIRQQFRTLRMFRDRMQEKYSNERHPLRYLSMGMTNDYPIAIEEGATHLRIGSAVFHP